VDQVDDPVDPVDPVDDPVDPVDQVDDPVAGPAVDGPVADTLPAGRYAPSA
tara:strand:+ start:673 stop:825 length:153 start_codon:yes stop_codon:yes gene_type:complete